MDRELVSAGLVKNVIKKEIQAELRTWPPLEQSSVGLFVFSLVPNVLPSSFQRVLELINLFPKYSPSSQSVLQHVPMFPCSQFVPHTFGNGNNAQPMRGATCWSFKDRI